MKADTALFKEKPNRKMTWKSSNDKIKNEIDHLLVNDARVAINSEVTVSFAFPSDHRICRCTVKIQDIIKF